MYYRAFFAGNTLGCNHTQGRNITIHDTWQITSCPPPSSADNSKKLNIQNIFVWVNKIDKAK